MGHDPGAGRIEARSEGLVGDEVARAKRQGQDASGIFNANRRRAQPMQQLSIEIDQVEQRQKNRRLMELPPDTPRTPACRWGRANADESVDHANLEGDRGPSIRAEGALGYGHGAGDSRFERAAKFGGRALPSLGAARGSARWRVHARPAHARARLPRVHTAVPGERATMRHGTAAQVRSRPVQDRRRVGAVHFDSHRRSPADQPPPDEILNGDPLPLMYIAFTPCFRSEAGSSARTCEA